MGRSGRDNTGKSDRVGGLGGGVPQDSRRADAVGPMMGDERVAAALIVGPRWLRESMRARLGGSGLEYGATANERAALEHASSGAFDVVIVGLEADEMSGEQAGACGSGDERDAGGSLIERLREADGTLSIMAVSSEPTLDLAVDAMRLGACDLLGRDTRGSEVVSRVLLAVDRCRAARKAQERVDQLQGLCTQLNTAREEVTKHVGSLCDDLVIAYQDMSDQITRVSLASEFNSIIRQQLDIEELLRTALEYILAKCGSTNAGVFLPASSGDYSLGAYVNYDCPKDTAEMLLDHLADVLPMRFEDSDGLVTLTGHDELASELGDDAHWLDGKSLTVFTCREDGECLAVVALFRDEREPMDAEALEALEIIADLFAQQLGRVIHVHHRHLPQDEWGQFGDEPGDGYDQGDGFGGMEGLGGRDDVDGYEDVDDIDLAA